jgi:hypothetical protein
MTKTPSAKVDKIGFTPYDSTKEVNKGEKPEWDGTIYNNL